MAGAFGYVLKRGDPKAGSVLIKVLHLRSGETYILTQANMGDETKWIKPITTNDLSILTAYIEREIRFDDDLWVIELEDVEGRHFLTEAVVKDEIKRL
jgi:hypothetical protein